VAGADQRTGLKELFSWMGAVATVLPSIFIATLPVGTAIKFLENPEVGMELIRPEPSSGSPY
jgi:hypothetical protein